MSEPNFSPDTLYAGHKTSLNKFQSTEVILNIFSDLKTDQEEVSGKSPTAWKWNNTLLNNAWVKEITGEIRKKLEIKDNKNTIYQNL